ncbi:MAG: hypothetical protein IJU54_01825 [Alphaproteobacteria bacterium]|nr:hypothetical protein [Alphaproteobacteria bacterium]
MNNMTLTCLLICNLITCIVNASNTTQWNEINEINHVKCGMQTYPEKIETYDHFIQAINWLNNYYMNKTNNVGENGNNSANSKNIKSSTDSESKDNVVTIKVMHSNTPLNITNNDLNCTLISLINSFGIPHYSDKSFFNKLYYRYKTLSTIQNFYKDYKVLPIDLLILLDNCFQDTNKLDNILSKKSKLINIEIKISDMIDRLEKWYPYITNITFKEEIETEIKNILITVNDINKTMNYNKYIKELNIDQILQSNSDPVEVLQSFIKYFDELNKKYKMSNPVLSVYDLSIDNDKYILLEKYNKLAIKATEFSDNFIINCGNLFNEYYNKSSTLNTERLNKFINKNISTILFNNEPIDLTSINVAFFDTDLKRVFHHATIIKTSDNKWMLIDSNKKHNNKSITIYNSLSDIFVNQHNYITQIADICEKDKNNIIQYKLFPTLLFYKKAKCNNTVQNTISIFRSNNIKLISKFDEQVHKNYKKELNNIKIDLDKLQEDTKNEISVHDKNREKPLGVTVGCNNFDMLNNQNFVHTNEDQDVLDLEEFNCDDKLSFDCNSSTMPENNNKSIQNKVKQNTNIKHNDKQETLDFSDDGFNIFDIGSNNTNYNENNSEKLLSNKKVPR